MNDDTASFGQRAKQTFTRLIVVLLLLGMGGAVGFLLSERNARTFSVVMEDGKLMVMKGRMAPIGAELYKPHDAALADTYAPIPLEGSSVREMAEVRYTERDELDRALFDVLERLARPRVDSDDPPTLDKGLYYLRRAEKLSGVSSDQRQTLKSLQADVSFYIARTKLDDARRQVAEALAQLKISAESTNRHARAANQMISEVETPSKALEESLRRAVHLLSESAQPAAGAASAPTTDAKPPVMPEGSHTPSPPLPPGLSLPPPSPAPTTVPPTVEPKVEAPPVAGH